MSSRTKDDHFCLSCQRWHGLPYCDPMPAACGECEGTQEHNNGCSQIDAADLARPSSNQRPYCTYEGCKEVCVDAENKRLREFLQLWIYEGRLQSFEDRERFRKAAQALVSGTPSPVETSDNERMRNTLLQAGYTDCGGELWKPPLGPRPVFLEDNTRLRAGLRRIGEQSLSFKLVVDRLLDGESIEDIASSPLEPSPVKAIADQDPNERCSNCDVKRSLHDAGGVGSCRNWRAEKASGESRAEFERDRGFVRRCLKCGEQLVPYAGCPKCDVTAENGSEKQT